MINISLPTRERRALLLGGAVIFLGIFFGRAFPAARRWESSSWGQSHAATAELARSRAEYRSLPETRDSAAARRRRLIALAPRVLEGRTASGAAASLAALVAGAAARSEVEIGSVEVRHDSVGVAYFVPVRVRADATGTLPGLMRMLVLLEEGPELLRIPDWSITQPNPGGPADQPERLRLELTVEGLSAPEPPSGQ